MDYEAQERWQNKVGLISKSYKLRKDVVEKFSKKCKENGVSQASVLTAFMKFYSE